MNRQDIIERITTDTPTPWITRAGQYLMNWLVLFDHAANTLLLGHPAEALTSRIARVLDNPVNLRGTELWNWGNPKPAELKDPDPEPIKDTSYPDIPPKTVIVIPPSPQTTNFRFTAAVLRIDVKHSLHS